MASKLVSGLAFATIVAAAAGGVFVSSSALSEEVPAGKLPSAAAAPGTMGPDRSHLHHIPADVLKHLSLKCNRAAMQGLVDFGTAAQCSMVHEELRERVFGGSFEALISWSRNAGPGTE